MRCSSTSCGREGDGKFCEECGSKMVEENMDAVVICSGKLGSPCGSELVLGQKFCKNCGSKVNQALFSSLHHACRKCGKVLDQDAKFCMECGCKVEKPTLASKPASLTKEKESNEAEAQKAEETKKPSVIDVEMTEPQTDIITQEDLTTSKVNTALIKTDVGEGGGEDGQNENNEKSFEPRKSFPEDKFTSEIPESDLLNTGEITDARDKTSSIENDVDMECDNGNQKEKLKDERKNSENVSIIHESQNKDIAEKLEHVHIRTNVQGNLKITDNSKLASEENVTTNKLNVETIGIGGDKENENDINMTHNVGNEQVKGSRSQRENEKKKKQDNGEAKEDKNCEASKDVQTKGKPESDQDVEKTTEKDRNTSSKEAQEEMSVKTPSNQLSENKRPKVSDIRQTSITEEQATKGTKEDATEGDFVQIGNANSTPGSERTYDHSGKEDNRENKSDASGAEKVFGSGKSIGMTQTGNDVEVKSPLGSNLFIVDSPAKNEPIADPDASGSQMNGGKKALTNEPVVPAEKERIDDGKPVSNKNLNMQMMEDHEGTREDNPSERVTKSKTKTKTDEENKNKQQELPKKQSKAKVDTSKQKAVQNKSGDKCIKVQFHILTSEDFKFDPKKDKCILVIGNHEMGGWNKRDKQMKDKRKIEPYVYEMIHEETIPTRLIAGGHSIPYKYLIIKNDKPTDELWEHYLKNKKAGPDSNRDLTISLSLKGLDLWHQFDCFMEQTPKSLKERVCDYFRKDLKKHAEKAVQIFCPNIVEHDKSHIPVEEVVQLFQMASFCMKKIYMVDGKCWKDVKEYSQFMGTSLIKTVIDKWKIDTTVDSATHNEHVTTAALTILHVINTLDLGMPDIKSIHQLTKALIMKPDGEKKECPDLTLADRLFPEKRNVLLEAVLKFAKNIMGTTKNPCWLSLMPWVHFLSGQCVPFEPAEVDVKHDSNDGKWWGLIAIKDALETFKKRHTKWEIPLEKMLKHLKPLFEMDYLLPRTLTAAVDLSDLPELIKSETIPIEVCLANIIFQLRVHEPTKYYLSHELGSWYMSFEEKIIQACVDSVLKKLQATFFSEKCFLSQWKMCYIIAFHLFKESIYSNRTEIITLCVQVLLHCVAMFDRVLFELKSESDLKSNEHFAVLREALKETVRLLELYINDWNIYMINILQVWNSVFASVQLQSEEVRDFWNKGLSEALVINLQTMNSFLPTMPQDDLQDIKEALLAARNQVSGADHNPVFYMWTAGNCG